MGNLSATLTLLLVVLLQGCLAYPGGPPTSACDSLRPQHPPSLSDGDGGYLISTNIPVNSAENGYEYNASATYTVTLRGTNTFRGFAVQSVSIVDGSAVGSFTPGANQQLLGCSPPDYTIVHNNSARNEFSEQTFTWVAPSTSGEVNFLYSVVRVQTEYYVRLSAIGEAPPTMPTQPPFDFVAAGVTVPMVAPVDFRLIIKDPTSCNVSDCNIFVGIQTNEGNDEFLDFYIEGRASAWVAVGFSPSSNMFSADVFACNMATDMVEVLDTWNAESGRSNARDNLMDTFMFSSSVDDGRIKCLFGRSIAGNNGTQDFNLNNIYYVLFGRSNGSPSSGFLSTHRNRADRNPFISRERVIAAETTGVFGAGDSDKIKRALVQTHGILMLIAWPILANIGIYFAASMRYSFSKGEWFQFHRAFMIGSLLVAALAFFLVFFSQLDSNPRGLIDLGTGSALQRTRLAHFVIGILVMALHIVNPIIAIFRCHPGEKNRWIFDLLHGFPGVGTIAFVLAICNVLLGLAIFSFDFSRFGNLTLFWIYFGSAISTLSWYFIVSAIKFPWRIKAWKKDGKDDDFAVEMDKTDGENVIIKGQEKSTKGCGKKGKGCGKKGKGCGNKCDGEDQSFCSKYGHWIGLTAYVFFPVIIVFTLIVLIALPL